MDRNRVLVDINQKDEQFAISYELLCLLRWFVEHDADRLKKMTVKAVAKGLYERLQQLRHDSEQQALEDAHENMLEFFGALEGMMIDAVQEALLQRAWQKNIMPALERIDVTACDDALVKSSLEKTQGVVLSGVGSQNPQEIVLAEILRQWKPLREDASH